MCFVLFEECGRTPLGIFRKREELVGVAVLAFHRPDARLIFFERVDMHHPVEDNWNELPTRCVTSFLRIDRSLQTELGIVSR